MGVHPTISHDRWPRQSADLGARVEVCFGYDTRKLTRGIVLRDDMEAPFRTIIQLDDGRVVLASECQYTFATAPHTTER